MKHLVFIIFAASVLAISGWANPAGSQANSQASPPASQPIAADRGNDLENSRKARALLDQALQDMGGKASLGIPDIEQEGRTYSFSHGRPTSNGVLFWRFVEFPDKERIEVTKQRDVAYLYVGEKGYELTLKGPHAVEKKDLEEYRRHRRFSLDTVLRTWTNDPGIAFFYDGNALAGNLPAQRITLINAKNEAVSLFFDIDTHLPIKKSYTWRDPVDKERNLEEEIFDNYRHVHGMMISWGFTRYFYVDMQRQRFSRSVHINQGLNEAMFDPNSGYYPNKTPAKHYSKPQP